jgi:hypothetical protein
MNNRLNQPLGVLFLAASTLSFAAAPAPDAGKATLAIAIEAWVVLLENDDPRAAERWAGDEAASKALKEQWAKLRECHKQYDYRKWIDGSYEPGSTGAAKIGDAARFTVGGHSYGRLHTEWARTDDGWRVNTVWMCR